MKKLFSFLALLLFVAASPVKALVSDLNPNDVVSVDPVLRYTFTTGKWYVMYNVGRKVYIYGNGGHRSTLFTDCSTVQESAPYMLRFVDTGDGKYYIQKADGNYFKDLVTWNANPGVTTNIAEAGKFTLGDINGNAGHWYVQGSRYLMDSNGTQVVAYGTEPTLNGNSDWTIYEAKVLDPSELTGSNLVKLQLVRGGLFRIQSRGNTSQYICETTAHKGSTTTRNVSASNRMSQMWIIEHSDDGYSLRNAQTGNYLQSNYNCTKSKYFWTMQMSPNNTSEADKYIIICHGEVKSGSTNCANLKGGSSGLTDWYYNNDRNSEWIIQPVEYTEVDTATVRANLDNICGVGTIDLEAGAYYKFTNIDDGKVLAERKNDNRVITADAADDAWEQYWKIVLNEEDNTYTLQNVFSGRYINRKASSPSSACGGNYTTSATGSTSRNWNLELSPYAWNSSYNIIEPLKPETGIGVKDGNSVNADINSTSAQWIVNRVDLTEEQLQAAADAYEEYNLINNTSTSLLNSRLQNFFSDYACTTLKDEYKDATDEDLAAAMKEAGLAKLLINMALKIKNESWGHREKEFRIYDYEAYSDPTQWNSTRLVGTSYQFSPQTSPTGISVKQGDVVILFVGANTPTYSTLTFSNNQDYEIAPSVVSLKRGINVYVPNKDGHLFIHYTITNTSKKLADFAPITVHIEGGRVQGYFDITRGHTNADWKDMVANTFQDRIVHLKNKYYQFNMDYKELLKQISDEELDEIDTDGVAKGIEGTLHRWDALVAVQRDLMNANSFADRFNCMLSASSSSDGNPYATTYGTYYPGVGTIMNYEAMTHGKENDSGANYWCIAHETGHVHQNLINLAGCTEISNNFFSQVNTWTQGSNTGRGGPWKEARNAFYEGKFWNDYDLWQRCRMYFQLWLYFHLMEHNTTFYQQLFDKFRDSPIQMSTNASSPGSGTTDYLKFAKFCCDIAQADLSEFFQFWGFFVPVKDYVISDYSTKYMTTTQAEIDAAIAYMQKYPKKLGNIMFIDERIQKYPADYPGMAEGTMRVATSSEATPGDASEVGETGMFTDFVDITPHKKYQYMYRVKAKTLDIYRNTGAGAVGFKFYNADHKMIYAANTYSIVVPDEIAATEYYVVAALGDGTDIILYDPRNLTAIKDTAADEDTAFDETKPAYDLLGREVDDLKRGNIYIQNGKKVRY